MTAAATAIEKITSAEQKELSAALDVYRECITLLGNDTELSPKQNNALHEALKILEITTAEIAADVGTMRHLIALTVLERTIDTRVQAIETEGRAARKQADELRIEMNKLEIVANSANHRILLTLAPRSELRKLRTANPRLFSAAPIVRPAIPSAPATGLPPMPPADFEEQSRI
jgi:hypothetical protein